MGDNTAIVTFQRGWVEDGISADGLPHYKEAINLFKYVDKQTQMLDPATDEDFENPDFRDAWEAFKKEDKAREMTIGNEGFPLSLWPACTPAMFRMASARNIFTVEQLAALTVKKNLPGEIAELADRARQMVAHSRNVGKFEAILREKDGEIEALTEQIRELRTSVAGRDAMIDQMRSMAFLFQQPGGTVHGQ